MDWRLIAAVSAAGGSFCFVAVGAYVLLTGNPAPQRKFAPAPMLLSEYRFPAAAPPSLVSARASTPGPFAPQGTTVPQIPVMVSDSDIVPGRVSTSGLAPSLTAARGADDSKKSPRARSEPKHEVRALGDKSASLTPFDADTRPEPPPRPLVEVRKSSVVPELQTAIPTTRYRGVLTMAEIARIRHNLRLTPDQEPAWPPVEAALGEIGRQQIALIRHGQEPRISQSDWPPSRLYSVAGPLLRTLRPDQIEAVRRLCRSLGFESVASML